MSGSDDKSVIVWDKQTSQLLEELKGHDAQVCLLFTWIIDGSVVAKKNTIERKNGMSIYRYLFANYSEVELGEYLVLNANCFIVPLITLFNLADSFTVCVLVTFYSLFFTILGL